MKHYMKSNGNGGMNISWSMLGILCVIIGLTTATVTTAVTTRNKVDSLETDFDEIKNSVEEISILKVKLDNMAEDIKEIKEYIKGE